MDQWLHSSRDIRTVLGRRLPRRRALTAYAMRQNLDRQLCLVEARLPSLAMAMYDLIDLLLDNTFRNCAGQPWLPFRIERNWAKVLDLLHDEDFLSPSRKQ